MIFIGNAPCSWGNLEFEEMQTKPIGYEQMLDELVETGYTGTELGDWGFMPTQPDRLLDEIEKRNLTMTGAFVPIAFVDDSVHDEGEARAVKTAKLLASVANKNNPPFVVLADDNGSVSLRTKHAGRIKPYMRLSEEAWRVFADGVNRVAIAVKRETGLRCVFHHHCAGYVETPDEISTLLSLTDPDLVGLVFDTGHYAFGSTQPNAQIVLDGLNRFADRIAYVHFKDCEPSVAKRSRDEGWDYFVCIRHGIFCELGKGCVDFAAVVQWLERRGYSGYITVEQDVLPGLGTPKESAKRNRDFLKGIGI